MIVEIQWHLITGEVCEEGKRKRNFALYGVKVTWVKKCCFQRKIICGRFFIIIIISFLMSLSLSSQFGQ